MEQIILGAHLLVALAIIGLILLQQGKGAEMGASFGAGGSQTLFGSDGGGSVLTKATACLVALFFASSFSLAVLINQRADIVDDLDLAIPAAAEVKTAADGELPVLDTASPAVTGSKGDDLPSLD
ncbi:MAG: preprotein translocase subunit SecG [Halioglobus sp.]